MVYAPSRRRTFDGRGEGLSWTVAASGGADGQPGRVGDECPDVVAATVRVATVPRRRGRQRVEVALVTVMVDGGGLTGVAGESGLADGRACARRVGAKLSFLLYTVDCIAGSVALCRGWYSVDANCREPRLEAGPLDFARIRALQGCRVAGTRVCKPSGIPW